MDPQNWSDERLDALLNQLAERAEERDDISLPGSGVTRRATLAGLLGLGGAAAGGAGLAAAIGESESYGSASGVVGTDNEPLQELNAKNGHFQSAVVDNTLQTEQVAIGQQHATLFWTKSKTVPSGSATSVPYGSTETADADVVTVDTTAGTITADVAGTWLIRASATWDTASGWSTDDSAEIQVDVDGVRVADPDGLKTGTRKEGTSVTTVQDISAGGVVSADVFQDSGSSKTISGSKETARLTAVRIG